MTLPITAGTLRIVGERLRAAYPGNAQIDEACGLVYRIWEKGQLSRYDLAEQVLLILEVMPELGWALAVLARQLELPVEELIEEERPVIRVLQPAGGGVGE